MFNFEGLIKNEHMFISHTTFKTVKYLIYLKLFT